MVDGTLWFVSPLHIRFSQDSISENFKPFIKDGQLCTNTSILDSVEELLQPFEEPRLLPGDNHRTVVI